MPKKNELHSRKSLAEGRFLRIDELQFTDRHGKNRRWETADRVNSRGAAIIIAEIVPDGTLILVRQFRPPAWQYVIEFPAGLIDPGESAAATAVRELREETGFEGEVVRVLPESTSSPGMSSEKMVVILMKVDGSRYRDGLPPSFQEENEDIETLLVPKKGLLDFLEAEAAAGTGIDAKLLHYALGLEQ